MTLYRKYRPKSFSEMVGQEAIVKTLTQAAISNNLSHAYLFAGPRGTGKTSTARIIAKILNCTDLKSAEPCLKCENCLGIESAQMTDILEIDAASNRGIDEVRQLKNSLQFAPSYAKKKVIIIDEVHMLTFEAFNALLKTLEEPPPYVHFVLATTELHKVPATIKSRCQIFNFSEVSLTQLVKHLENICKKEQLKYETAALELIAEMANGGVRDSLSILQKVANLEEIKFQETLEMLGVNFMQDAKDLSQAVLDIDTQRCAEICARQKNAGCDPKAFAKQVVDQWHQLLNQSVIDKSPQLSLIAQTLNQFYELESNLAHSHYYWSTFVILTSLLDPASAVQAISPPKVVAQAVLQPKLSSKAGPTPSQQITPVTPIAVKKTEAKEQRSKIVTANPKPKVVTVQAERKQQAVVNSKPGDVDGFINGFAEIRKSVDNPKLKRLLAQVKLVKTATGLELQMTSDFFLSQLKAPEPQMSLQKVFAQHGLEGRISYGLTSNAAQSTSETIQQVEEVAEFFGGEITDD